MDFVVNEWLPEYFRSDATVEEKRKLEVFLNKFMLRKDVLYVRRPSEFLGKIYRYAKLHQHDNKVSTELKKFIKTILYDSERCFFVDDGEFNLADEITAKLTEGGNTISDKYLFEAATMTSTKTIVTTDLPLKSLMIDNVTFKIELLDDFLTRY